MELQEVLFIIPQKLPAINSLPKCWSWVCWPWDLFFHTVHSSIFLFFYQAKEFVNDGFIDAIKNYDYKDSSLDKAVDDLQSKVSITPNTCTPRRL